VQLWDVQEPEAPPIILRPEGEVTSVAFSPDGQWLASASKDGMILVWLAHTNTLSEMVCKKV
jgi:WD40 repeat protein